MTTNHHSDTPTVTDLADTATELLATAHAQPAQRASKTLMSTPVMRGTLIALIAGTELAEHEAPAAATLHVITGEAQLSTHEQQWRLSTGQWITIPQSRHGLQALTDTAVLLTVALHGRDLHE